MGKSASRLEVQVEAPGRGKLAVAGRPKDVRRAIRWWAANRDPLTPAPKQATGFQK